MYAYTLLMFKNTTAQTAIRPASKEICWQFLYSWNVAKTLIGSFMIAFMEVQIKGEWLLCLAWLERVVGFALNQIYADCNSSAWGLNLIVKLMNHSNKCIAIPDRVFCKLPIWSWSKQICWFYIFCHVREQLI